MAQLKKGFKPNLTNFVDFTVLRVFEAKIHPRCPFLRIRCWPSDHLEPIGFWSASSCSHKKKPGRRAGPSPARTLGGENFGKAIRFARGGGANVFWEASSLEGVPLPLGSVPARRSLAPAPLARWPSPWSCPIRSDVVGTSSCAILGSGVSPRGLRRLSRPNSGALRRRQLGRGAGGFGISYRVPPWTGPPS